MQHYNKDNDDNVMRASMWFEFFGGFFGMSNPVIYGRECDNKEV